MLHGLTDHDCHRNWCRSNGCVNFRYIAISAVNVWFISKFVLWVAMVSFDSETVSCKIKETLQL